jgi:hypothetical protein
VGVEVGSTDACNMRKYIKPYLQLFRWKAAALLQRSVFAWVRIKVQWIKQRNPWSIIVD